MLILNSIEIRDLLVGIAAGELNKICADLLKKGRVASFRIVNAIKPCAVLVLMVTLRNWIFKPLTNPNTGPVACSSSYSFQSGGTLSEQMIIANIISEGLELVECESLFIESDIGAVSILFEVRYLPSGNMRAIKNSYLRLLTKYCRTIIFEK
uniref:Uncharacterized protein n=1 Tax=Glossina palpalis gambiensis TaxID=67801 RepID=A0A1B0BY00_9MUSC